MGELVFPSSLYCICCGKYTDSSRMYSLCDHCIRHMNFNMTNLKHISPTEKMSGIDHAAAAMGYGLYERQLIFGLKYGGKTYIARHIADILYDCLKKRLAEEGECPWLNADIIVPVPLHKDKLKKRGFNQAEKIGFYFGKRTGIRMQADVIIRTKNTTPQRALSPREREANMEKAFCINTGRREELKDKRILLIDDIFTTGATASACADCLKENGAGSVCFMALASAKNKSHQLV